MLEEYKMIIAGVVGSVVTLLITAVIDFCKQRYVSRLEMKKLVFQRRTDAAEKAMSWFQDGADCYKMMQMACDEINEKYNPVTWEKLIRSTSLANKLFGETAFRLNPLYLYDDFSEIEKRYNALQVNQDMNDAITKIGRLGLRASELRDRGVAEEAEELKEIQDKIVGLYREFANILDVQVSMIAEMQMKLKKQYSKYKI
ncbi:hypothetical protein [Bacteroides acidifaciens]|uniref:hypothetical protein n=1 Tax=Bacteroides acidifaciens TaxID=85831 RepID=UPI0025B2E55E|nr:hypothetical protein [Bacteroides acidifaciens]